MAETEKTQTRFTEIFGFSCNQGFLFALVLVGLPSHNISGLFPFQYFDSFCTVLFLALTLLVIRFLPPKAQTALLSRSIVFGYALLIVASAVVPLIPDSTALLGVLIQGILVGIPLAFLFCAWGRVLGSMPLDAAFRAVILSSTIGAAVCLLVLLIGLCANYDMLLFLYLLPLGSASALFSELKELPGTEQYAAASAQESPSTKVTDLYLRVHLGALAFGIASGFMELLVSDLATDQQVSLVIGLFFFVVLAIVALQLFDTAAVPEQSSSKIGLLFASPQGALAYIYRITVCLIIMGCLLTPVLSGIAVNGQAIIAAGFLGLLMALVNIFLARALSSNTSAVLSFSLGFAFLFGGQALGIAVANDLLSRAVFADTEPVFACLCGVLVLIAFLFLFSESDLQALNVAAQAADHFDEACAQMAEHYGLSKREAEILPLAVRGRTGERIADQFCISKSTVDTHLRRIYNKCGVHSRQELIDLSETVAEKMAQQ